MEYVRRTNSIIDKLKKLGLKSTVPSTARCPWPVGGGIQVTGRLGTCFSIFKRQG